MALKASVDNSMVENKPRFSVGILTFNSERTLAMVLKAVFGQGYPRESLDVFVVDAGSSDRTVGIATEFGVNVYSEKGCARGRGRNICIQRAKSDLLVMLDSDIIIPKGWLALVEGYFKDPAVTEVASPYFTPEPKSGFVNRVLYYLTSGWQVHGKGALRRENWVSE